ncbi:beta-1,3-galactosyltransferase brn-like [Uloborus diversus]|uniref:beta-1,3-galactosyltransferase brn-like n=1 Tax=Uloborus diversus TaxID=327109 RepID=UPI00240A7743|nr:beta-1,3-galactosyltransferase brn-like [Uloborus diversus]
MKRIVHSSITFLRSRIKLVILAVILLAAIEHFGLFLHLFERDYSSFSYPLEIPIGETLETIRKGLKPPYQPINVYNYSYKITSLHKCRALDNEYEKIVILYVIKSAIPHLSRRDAIRKSWGWENRFSDVNIRRIFVLGLTTEFGMQEQIDDEAIKNKDIVQAEFMDNYYNNTIKTMMAFKWVTQNCPKTQFIAFADDDMYVSTKNLLKFVRNPFNRRVGFRRRRSVDYPLYQDPLLSAFDGRLFSGFLFDSSPMRHKSSKWFVSLAEYPFSRYPPYVTAGAFVLSYPALEDMYYASLFTKHFRFDDVYLGILAKKCGITPLHNEHFHFWRKEYTKEGYRNVIASHGFGDPQELTAIYEEQRSAGHA